MFIIRKILLIAVAVLEISGSPLFQGISFQRGFEINFKPFVRKPISFLKEKWSPLGVFGKKFAIEKRSLDDMVPPKPPERVPRPAAPVFEHVEEIEHIGPGPLLILPKPVIAPVEISNPPPAPPAVEPPPPPLPSPMPIIINELPPLPEESHVLPPISTNMVIIQPTKLVTHHGSSGLYTDITHVESVKEHINCIKPPPPLIEVEPPKPPDAPVAPPPVEPVPPPPVESIPPPVVESVPPPVPPPVVEPIPPPVVVPVVPPPVVEPEIPPPAPIPPPPPPVPIKEEPKEVPVPPVSTQGSRSELFLKDSSLIKGSKMALQFGTVFLSLMAQFFDSARATLDQMTNPPPKFNK